MRSHASQQQRTHRSDTAVRQLRDLLRADILHSAGAVEHLPSESELMMEYRVTRSTVREALGLLRTEGWVDRLQGVGTVVAAIPVKASLVETTPAHPATSAPTRTQISSATPRILESTVIPLTGAVGRRLEATSGECLRVEYEFMIDGAIGGLVTNYVLFPEAERLQATPFESHWYDYLADAEIVVGDVAFLFSAASADASVAHHLGVPVGSAITLVYQVIRDALLRPFNFAVMYLRPDRVLLSSQGPLGRSGSPP